MINNYPFFCKLVHAFNQFILDLLTITTIKLFMKKPSFYIVFFLLILSLNANAQKSRFRDLYPLAKPSSSLIQLDSEFSQCMMAIGGGGLMIELPNTPKSSSDPEAFTKKDFHECILAIIVYANDLIDQQNNSSSGSNTTAKESLLKDIQKLLKSKKYQKMITFIKSKGYPVSDDSKKLFFIWNDYILDVKENRPWVYPANKNVTKTYRAILAYVSKNYDQPFGMQAEEGAVLADATQALSNCMENPESLMWQGEGKIDMDQKDELRRLASSVAYLEWRIHEPINALRSKSINRAKFYCIQQAFYDVVLSMVRSKKDWHKEGMHGTNLLTLYNETKVSGWDVNGDKASRNN